MNVKICIAIKAELRINTQFKKTFPNYTISDILTNRLLLLPVDLDKNCLLFTKRLLMVNKSIVYS